MALKLDFTVKVAAAFTKVLDLATISDPLSLEKILNLTNGTGKDQADQLFHDKRTLTASATENLDLAGVLTDAFGTVMTFARIKGIIIVAAAGNTNNVQVGGAATNAFVNWVANATDIINVRPNGVFAIFAPGATAYVVTVATGDILKIANSGAGSSVTYDIIIVGASA